MNIGGNPNSGNSANLRADVIKAGAFGANGQLNIGNSSLNANSLIRLYATGSNGEPQLYCHDHLEFQFPDRAGGQHHHHSAERRCLIQGDNGVANVYTNNPNYSGFGGTNPTNGTSAAMVRTRRTHS
ncbi:MAG: hypothetical protein ABIR71_07135 [Chthoniobacterales bacterium]